MERGKYYGSTGTALCDNDKSKLRFADTSIQCANFITQVKPNIRRKFTYFI